MQIANTSWSTRDIDWSVDGNYCFIASGNSVSEYLDLDMLMTKLMVMLMGLIMF